MSTNRQQPALPPQLRTALGFLDLDLEDELARYRRHRAICRLTPGIRQGSEITVPKRAVALPEIAAYSSGADTTTNVAQNSLPGLPPHLKLPDAWSDQPPTEAAGAAAEYVTSSDTAAPPQDFLASSEALLKGLNQRERDSSVPPPQHRPLLTPWRIAAGTIFIVSGVLLYNILQPAESPVLTQSTAPITAPETEPSPVTPASVAPPSSPVPDLAAEEFKDVNLSNLSQLEQQSASTPPSASTAVAPTPATSPAAQPPAPTPAPLGKQITGAPTDPGRDYYYVVVDYVDQAGLTKAQRVITDAYVVNFPEGAKIQMAVFDNLEAAQVLVQSLNRAGVPAKVRQPS